MFVKMKDALIVMYFNRQNVVIKFYTRVWRECLQQKYQTISKIIKNIKKIFFCVCMYKMVYYFQRNI